MNLPNGLTLSRLAAVPPLMALLVVRFPGHDQLAAALFIVFSLTDILDGQIARRRGTDRAQHPRRSSPGSSGGNRAAPGSRHSRGVASSWRCRSMTVKPSAGRGRAIRPAGRYQTAIETAPCAA